MKKFDVIVVGSGAGLEVASFATEHNLSVVLTISIQHYQNGSKERFLQ